MSFSYSRDQSLGYLTGLASRLLNNILTSRFQKAGIDMTAEQWGAIIVLLNSEPLTQRRLGGQLCLEKSSVSRLVHGLERRGWVVRSSDPTDSRQKLVTPTPKLLDTAERCAVIAGRILEEAQTGSSENEISTVKSVLASSIKNLQEMAELATNPIDHDLGDQHEKT